FLQVPETNPCVIQAAVLQREVESPAIVYKCVLRWLFLVLLTFFVDIIPQLVQSKYLHMLRWKRFCAHSSVIGQFYSLYQE
ncbi:CF183 protein, partial [Tachuris rubrigastra]|nr:CF183 protein [Tachuris rubrigastra]